MEGHVRWRDAHRFRERARRNAARPLISELVDKIGIMYAGKIVEFNSTKEIIFAPKNEYTKNLILSTPQLKQTL